MLYWYATKSSMGKGGVLKHLRSSGGYCEFSPEVSGLNRYIHLAGKENCLYFSPVIKHH